MSRTATVERLSFRDSDHTYYLEGKRLPSVTTILGNYSAPGLMWWSARVGGEAVRDHLNAIADAADETKIGDVSVAALDLRSLADEMYELARTQHTKRAAKAASKGSLVHDAIQKFHEDFFACDLEAELEDVDEDMRERVLTAFEAFTTWWADSGLRCISVERKIVGPNQAYAGRLDLLAQDEDDRFFVCDMKTSNGIYPTALVQNAAYAAALEDEWADDSGDEPPTISGTKVLWLPEKLDKLVVVERDEEEWRDDYAILFHPMLAAHARRRALDAWTSDINKANTPKEEEAA